jgi:predicted HAD superfamily phosphohydrolase YqeG
MREKEFRPLMRFSDKQTEEMMKDLYFEAYLASHKVIVTGERSLTDYALFSEKLDAVLVQTDGNLVAEDGHDYTFLLGSSEGAETLASRYADEHRISKILYPVNLSFQQFAESFRYGEMLATAEAVVVIGDGLNEDVKGLIESAKAKGILVYTAL